LKDFGIRFGINDRERFEKLRSLFAELKRDKDSGEFRDPSAWPQLVPDDVKAGFHWPTEDERAKWLAVRDSIPIAISHPSQQLGAAWNFYSVFEAVEDGEYDLLGCEMVGDSVAEMRIDPHSYPYGGVGPFIALVEAFGFGVLGVNECGEYESRDQLSGTGEPA
jgi:hypothetical protein